MVGRRYRGSSYPEARCDDDERGMSSAWSFYGLNGMQLTLSNDEAYEFVMAIASGELDDVAPSA